MKRFPVCRLHDVITFVATGQWRRVKSPYVVGFGVFLLSESVVVAALTLAHVGEPEASWLSGATSWDAVHYLRVAGFGYSYTEDQPSNVAFFPGFPMLVRVVFTVCGCSLALAGFLVANGATLVFLVLLAFYAKVRVENQEESSANAKITRSQSVVWLTTWCAALIPTSFFLRMVYSEACFLVLLTACLLAIELKKPSYLVAALCGTATAFRPVGVALLPVALVYTTSRGQGIARRLGIGVLSAFGILSYMAYQAVRFGSPFGFATTQAYWKTREDLGVWDRILSLASLEPVWATYLPESFYDWRRFGDPSVLGLTFGNPIYFVLTCALLGFGAWRCWLTKYELLASLGLIGIPYVTRAYDMAFLSQGRFCVVVVPVYLVAALLLVRLPVWLRFVLLVGSGGLMGLYAFRFANGALFFC